MNFINFQEFKRVRAELDDVIQYLSAELGSSLRNLKIGLQKLTFLENFESFQSTVTIAAGATVSIPNQFRDGAIPSQRIIVRCTGSAQIVDGTWTKDLLQLTNQGASSATITVVFLK